MSEEKWAMMVEWDQEKNVFPECECMECFKCHEFFHDDFKRWAKKGCPFCYDVRKKVLIHDRKQGKRVQQIKIEKEALI